jgi:hypothetical protein
MIIKKRRIRYNIPENAFKNFDDDGRPLRADELASQILTLTGNWPRRIGDQLWVISNGQPYRLKSSSALCGWLGMRLNVILYFRSGNGHIGRTGVLRAIMPHCESITMAELQEIAAAEQVQPDQIGGGL